MSGWAIPREERSTTMTGMILCHAHGDTEWCYVQADGAHIDSSQCRCIWTAVPSCPVDEHREAARERARSNRTAGPPGDVPRGGSPPFASQPRDRDGSNTRR
ncbi:MAG: hypothetical protein HYY04_16425 [Chloroflexi bacterium]|nr:hypothetical protein [Chloroflexota bacterium]